MNLSSTRACYARILRFFAVCALLFSPALSNSSQAQCLTASNGQYPSTTYTPTCTGSAEAITSLGYAGEYSVVTLTAGVPYTFTSSVATDYITISNSGGTVALASGVTPISYTPATSVTVRFYTHTSSACGSQSTSRTRSVSCALPAPANNNCSGAIALTVNPTATLAAVATFTTDGATQSMTGCIGTADDDVWYKFTATATRHNFAVTSSTGADLVHEVFSGSCGSLTSIGCSDPNTSSYDCFVPGQVYYVRVYTYFNTSASGTVTLGVGTPSTSADATCASSSQICAPFTFTAGQNQPSGGGGCGANYGCLISQPNPEYHWIRVQTGGTVAFTYASSASVDIDYALWGPFNAPNNPNPPGCSLLQGQPTVCGATLGAPVSCDFTTASSGTMTSVTATAGQYFLLLVTNYSNTATTVTIGNGAGTAIISCPTIITKLTAVPGACSGTNNQYTLTGIINTTNAPATGTLTISDNNGNSQVFSAPFAASINYSISGNAANGAQHTVTAVYSAAQPAARCVDYAAPAPCCTTPLPAAANVTDNACGYSYDLSATGGTPPYEWSTSSTFSPLLNMLTGYTLSTPGASAVYYVRSAGQTCYTSINVTDPTPANGLTGGNCQTCNIADMQTRTFYDASNKIIATVTDDASAGALGATTACATVDASPGTLNGQHYLQRHFDISVANNGPGTVTLYLTQAEINALVAASAGDGIPFSGVSNMCVMAYHGGAGTPSSHTSQEVIPHSALTITGPDVNNNYTVTFPVSSFSGFYCYGCNQSIALPVQLDQFTGVNTGNQNLLSWNTRSEHDVNYFMLERSENGHDWSAISHAIPALGGSTGNHYQFMDASLKTSLYYYRLKMTGNSGDDTYSQVVRLSSGKHATLSVYPNPATTLLNVIYSSADKQSLNILVLNAQGQLIREVSGSAVAANNLVQIPVQDMAPGMYYVQIKDSHGAIVATQKFVRQ